MSGRLWVRARVACRLPILFVLVAVIWSLGQVAAGADISPQSALRIRRMFVPVDSPRRWPTGEWRPWPLADFDRRVAALQPQPPAPHRAVITRANYSATLVNDQFRGGRCTWQLQRTGKNPTILSLEPWNMAVSELSWKDGSAIWGSDSLGRSMLLVDRTEGTIEGTWNLMGRALPQGQEFSLELPPATVTRLDLRLPAGQILQCAQGDVVGPDAAEAGWNRWQIDLGSRNLAQLVISRPLAASANRPLLITRREITYAVRPEAVRLQTDFKLEVLESPIRELRWLASPDLKVIGITLGDNTPVAWTEASLPAGRFLTVKLNDPLEGPGILLRIQALTTPQTDRSWAFPQLRLADAVHIDGQVNINVFPPLELADFQIEGYRQTALVTSSTDGETIVLRQLQPEGEAQILLASPRFQARCRLLSHVQTWGPAWTSVTQFEWSTPSGSTFSVRCGLPPDWEVTDVRDAENDSAGNVISWELLRSAGRPPVLRVEFREALSPDRPQRFRVLCRTAAAGLRKSIALPLFSPPANAEFEQFVSVAAESTASPALERGVQVDIVGVADFPTDASALSWKSSSPGTFPGGLLVKSRGPAPSGQFQLQAARDLADVQVTVRTEITRQKIVERFQLQIAPRNSPLKRVLVYISNGNGKNSEPPAWSNLSEPQRRLEAQRLEPSAHAAWNLPEAGELWEIRLTVPTAAEFTLSGVRSRPLKNPDHLALIHVPHANLFEGRVQVDHEGQLPFRIEARNLEAVVEPTGEGKSGQSVSPGRHQVWRYRDVASELICQVAGEQETLSSLIVTSLEVTARLSLEKSSTDRYWATFRLSEFSEGQAFHWGLPDEADLLQVTRDGVRVVPNRVGNDWVLLPAERRANHVVQVQYSVPTVVGFGPNSRRLILPRTPHAHLRFDLQVLLPETIRIDSSKTNIPLADPTEPVRLWRNLLFGPFARSAPDALFRPYLLEDWSGANQPGPGKSEDSLWGIATVSQGGRDSAPGLPPGWWPAKNSSEGWQVLRYSVPVAPKSVQLVLWSHRELWQSCWITLIAVVAVGTILRARRVRFAIVWGTLGLSVAVLLTIGLTGVPAEIAGSGLLGVIIAALIPQRWLVRPPSAAPQRTPKVPGGSTRSFPQPFPMKLLMLLGVTLSAAATVGIAGEENLPSANPAKSIPAGISETPYDILIPIDKLGNPAGPTPLAYLSPALHERLLAEQKATQEIPDYLIAEANYSGKVIAGQPFTVRARYKVVVLAAQSEVRVQFPFRGANLGGDDACLVDGKPHAVLPTSTGLGCLLQLPGIAEVPPAETTKGDKNPSAASYRQFSVEFRLHPTVTTRGQLAEAECGVPALLSASGTLAVEPSQSYAWIKSQSKEGFAVSVPAPAGTKQPPTIAYGKGKDLVWQWSPEMPPPPSPVETQWKFSTVLDLDPMLIQYHCRLHGRVAQGTVSSLRWKLPAGMSVRSLQGDDLLDWRLESLRDGVRAVWVAFKRPKSGNFLLLAELALPVRSGGNGTLTIPQLPLPVCGDPTNGPSHTTLYQIALRPPADFKMEEVLAVLPTSVGKLRASSSEQFLREQSVDGSRPFTPYVLDEPLPLSVRLETLRPQMEVGSTTIYRMSRDRLELNYTANIDTRGAPGFRYRLQVDPRLRISNVSVIEEGAERLLRWNSAPHDQILVFLNDRTTRRQVLRLEAHMALVVPTQLELPRVQLKYADQRSDHIALYHDAALNVSLEGMKQLLPLPPDPTEQFPSGRELPLGRYSLSSGAAPIRANISKNAPDVVVDRLFLLNSQEKPWRFSARLRLGMERGRGSEFQVIVPRKWVPVAEVHTEPASRQVSSLQPDGSLRLLLIPEEPVSESLVVTLRFPVSSRVGLNWDLPEIEVPGARRGLAFVVTPSRGVGVGVKASGRTLERLEPASLPAVLRPMLPEPPAGTEWLGTPVVGSSIRLQFPTATTTDGELRRVILSESQVSLSSTESQGRQLLWLPPEAGEQLELTWPPSLEPIAVLVDGVAAPFTRPRKDRLLIPLRSGPAGQTVLIGWKTTGFQSAGMRGVEALLLPSPRAATVEFDLLGVLSPEGLQLRSEDDRFATSAGNLALRRWEGLLHWHDAQLNANISDEQVNAADRLIRTIAFTTERLFRRWQRQGGTRVTAADMRRIQDLEKNTRELLTENFVEEFHRPLPANLVAQELPPSLTVLWPPGSLPANTCHLSQVDATADPIRIAYTTKQTFPWIAGVAWAALAGTVAFVLNRRRIIRWVQHRDGFALAMLGLVWWQCLLLGIAGFALLVAGLVWAAVQKWRQLRVPETPNPRGVIQQPQPG